MSLEIPLLGCWNLHRSVRVNQCQNIAGGCDLKKIMWTADILKVIPPNLHDPAIQLRQTAGIFTTVQAAVRGCDAMLSYAWSDGPLRSAVVRPSCTVLLPCILVCLFPLQRLWEFGKRSQGYFTAYITYLTRYSRESG